MQLKNGKLIYDLEKGKGSPKYYDYFCNGLRLKTKTSIKEALDLNLMVQRKDKITKEFQAFDYEQNGFVRIR